MDDEQRPLEEAILDRIEAIGAAQEKLRSHWNEEWSCETGFHNLDDLTKNNDYFDSPHEEEFAKLQTCRCKLRYYEDLLGEIGEVLEK